MLNAVDRFQIISRTLLVKIKKRWAHERKHGEPRHEGAPHVHFGIVTAVIRNLGECISKQAEERIRRKVFAFLECDDAHSVHQVEDIEVLNLSLTGGLWPFSLRKDNCDSGIITGLRDFPGIADKVELSSIPFK